MKLIVNEMTPRERLTTYAEGDEVDRNPVSLMAGETSPVMYGIKLRDYYFSADCMVTVESNLARDFGADNMGMGLGLRTLAEALGTELAYSDYDLSYVLKPGISNYAELEQRELVDITKDGRLPIMLEAFERLLDKFGQTHIVSTGMAGPLTTATNLIGTEQFLKDTRKQPEQIRKLMRYTTDCVIKCARDIHERLGISISISEPLASREILSLKQFREWMKPYLTETVQAFKEFQNAPSAHICGRTKDRWADICETGVSAFSVDNCEDLEELKEACGSQVGLIGNVKPVDVLRYGTPKEVEDAVYQCIIKAGDSSRGYTLSPGCTVPVNTPQENLLAFVNAASVYGKGARKGRLPKGVNEKTLFIE